MKLLRINAFETKPGEKGENDIRQKKNILLTFLGIHFYLNEKHDSFYDSWKIEIEFYGESYPYNLLARQNVPRHLLFRKGIFPWGCCATWEEIQKLMESRGLVLLGENSDLLYSMANRN